MTTESGSSAKRLRVTTGVVIWALLIGAPALPFVLGYLYAWTWVVPYVTVCKDGLLHSDFTADEYRLFLLNHGCSLEEAIGRYVKNWYAELSRPVFPDFNRSSAPPAQRYSADFIEAQARHVIAFVQGTETPRSLDNMALRDGVRTWLAQFEPFKMEETPCAADDVSCMFPPTHSPDFVERLFGWVADKYVAYAGPNLLDSINSGATQMAGLWGEGALTRGGLLVIYALLSGLMINAVYELIKGAVRN
jgi:hypothetical protein